MGPVLEFIHISVIKIIDIVGVALKKRIIGSNILAIGFINDAIKDKIIAAEKEYKKLINERDKVPATDL